MDILNICKRFFTSNPLYILWFLFYFYVSLKLINDNPTVIIFLYAISIAIALLCGETLLRFIERIRPLYSKMEKEYLLPIFEEVYSEAKEKHPELQNIEICTIDTVTIKVCAVGVKTVAVSKGAIDTFSENELKALMAHEIAHIINGDTITTLLTTIGNGFFALFVFVIKSAIMAYDIIGNKTVDKMWNSTIKMIFSIFIFIIVFPGEIILSMRSREKEYGADEFSYELGYGNDMIEALYLLDKINLGDNSSIVARMTASHPITAKRIGLLEAMVDGEANGQ